MQRYFIRVKGFENFGIGYEEVVPLKDNICAVKANDATIAQGANREVVTSLPLLYA